MWNIPPPPPPPPKRKCCGLDPPFKLKLEIRVSVRISWENFNANRGFFGFLQINIRYTSLRSDLLGKFTRKSVFSVFFKLILDIRVS